MTIIGFVFFIVVLVLLFVGYRIVSKGTGDYAAKLQAAAEADTRLSYWKGQAAERYDGLVLGNYTQAYVQHALLANDGISMGDAFFNTTGSDDTQGTVPFSYVTMPITAGDRPHLIIDSRHNNIAGRSLCDAATVGKRLQKIELEGDFPSDFTVYVEAGKEQELLVAMTPDVMAKLVDTLTNYDIELSGTELYLYSKFAFDLDKPAAREQYRTDIEHTKSLLGV